MSSRAHNAAQF